MSDETGLSVLRDMSKELAPSKIIPQALQGSPANIYLILLTGRDMGLAPTAALRMFDVVDGKISMRADGMAALVKKSGLCKSLKTTVSTEKECSYEGERSDIPGVEKFSFTIEDAKRANLLGKKNWAMYPADMLRARALARICRAMWPDVVGGLYDADELTPAPAQQPGAEMASAKERVAKYLVSQAQAPEVIEVKAEPVPVPKATEPDPLAEPAKQDEARHVPAKTCIIKAGELKGEDAYSLTQDQCYSVIKELEGKMAESPKARWVPQVKAHIEELKAIAPTLSETTEPTEQLPF